MPLLKALPREIGTGRDILKRREKAAARKELWRDHYRECFEYTMPARETFNWYAPGQRKNRHLYDSTGQACTYTAANNMQALLCPAWKHWAALSPGGDISEEEAESPDVIDGLQEATATVFSYLNHSNFQTVIPETFLDLMVGTASLSIEEGDDENPLVFDAIPLSMLEIEEGPNGSVETVYMRRTPLARNLTRMYRGMTDSGLPGVLQTQIRKKPDTEVEVVQGVIYAPKAKRYYGVVVHCESQEAIWVYDYEDSSPYIVARASVVAGEIYGRGRVMVALPDIKTLNAMQKAMLEHAELTVGGVYTGVSDGVMNPYTAVIAPKTIIPVASNDSANPSLRPLEIGGNFIITQEIMEGLRSNVRRILLGEMPNAGPVKSATEWAITDRNRMWDMGAEFGRIQAELLSKIISRAVWILQKRGKVPPLKVNGRQVTVKYTSPLARAQDQEDMLALQQTLEIGGVAAAMGGEAGQAAMMAGFKLEKLPAWLAKRTGLDADLIRSEEEQKKLAEAVVQTAQASGEVPA